MLGKEESDRVQNNILEQVNATEQGVENAKGLIQTLYKIEGYAQYADARKSDTVSAEEQITVLKGENYVNTR